MEEEDVEQPEIEIPETPIDENVDVDLGKNMDNKEEHVVTWYPAEKSEAKAEIKAERLDDNED